MHTNNVRNRSLSCISLSLSNPIIRIVITYSINAFKNQFAYIKTRTALVDCSEVANRGWASWDFVATFKRASRISKLFHNDFFNVLVSGCVLIFQQVRQGLGNFAY